jgi:hypothetical protein
MTVYQVADTIWNAMKGSDVIGVYQFNKKIFLNSGFFPLQYESSITKGLAN